LKQDVQLLKLNEINAQFSEFPVPLIT